MPQILPVLIPILTGAAAATSIGTGIYGLTQGGGGGGTQPQSDSSTAGATNLANQQSEKAAIARQVPSIQSQLGGSVSPDYYAAEAAREAGFPGDQNVARTALSNFLGLGSSPETQGATPGNQFGSSQGFQFNPLSVMQEQPEQQGVSGGFS